MIDTIQCGHLNLYQIRKAGVLGFYTLSHPGCPPATLLSVQPRVMHSWSSAAWHGTCVGRCSAKRGSNPQISVATDRLRGMAGRMLCGDLVLVLFSAALWVMREQRNKCDFVPEGWAAT